MIACCGELDRDDNYDDDDDDDECVINFCAYLCGRGALNFT